MNRLPVFVVALVVALLFLSSSLTNAQEQTNAVETSPRTDVLGAGQTSTRNNDQRDARQFEDYYNLGTTRALAGQYIEAIKFFKQAIELNPMDGDAHFSLGNVYSELGRWVEAAQAYRAAIRFRPNDGEAYNNLGLTYLKLDSADRAIVMFKQAIRIYPRWAQPRFNLSAAYNKLGRPGEAAAAHEQAIRLSTEYAARISSTASSIAARAHSASSNPSTGGNNDAGRKIVFTGDEIAASGTARQISTARDYVAVEPNNAKAFYKAGVNYGRSGRYKEAVEAFKQAVSLKGDYADAYYGLGHAYSDLGLWKEAIGAYEQLIRINPNDEEAFARLGRAYAKSRENAATVLKSSSSSLEVHQTSGASGQATPHPNSPTGLSSESVDLHGVSVTNHSDSKPQLLNETKPISLTSKAEAKGSPNADASPLKTDSPPPTTNASPLETDAPPLKISDESKQPVSTGVARAIDPTSVYRVGAGDVLDVQLLNAPAKQSTLYTVTAGGLLEYPLFAESLHVAGLTTDEISGLLGSEFKRRAVYDNPIVTVGVREYSSHNIIVSGLVNDPGSKVLRREAIPIYVVIADAQPRPEAGQAVIFARANGRRKTIDLLDTAAMDTLVFPGDVVTVSVKPKQFFYIGGRVASPGQRDYSPGITLTQAVLASGRELSTGGAVRVTRQGADGLLTTISYNLRSVASGKIPDPPVQPDDRIEVEP